MTVLEDGRNGGVDVSPWGKWDEWSLTAYCLLFHMIDVGAVAAELWDRLLTASQRTVISAGLGLDPEQARGVVAFLAALHDIGKLTPYFQRRVPAAWAGLSEELQADAGPVFSVWHARASMHVGLGLLTELGFQVGGNDSVAVRAAQCLGGHHGRFLQLDIDSAASAGRVAGVMGGQRWQELRSRYSRLLWHQFADGAVPRAMSVPAAVLITGLTMEADRLASPKSYWVDHADMPAAGAFEHHTLARKQAQKLVGERGLDRIPLEPVRFVDAHHGVGEPNAAQASILEQMPLAVAERGVGIVAVTDATGSGKSIMGLELARIFNEQCGSEGVAWLLPSTAAADGIHTALEAYVRAHPEAPSPVTVVHSQRHVRLDDPPPVANLADDEAFGPYEQAPADSEDGQVQLSSPGEWPGEGAHALLAQFTVTTVDQAQMAALPVHNSAHRLLALSGKTVIVDEAHALSPFSQLQLRRLLAWLGAMSCPVVLLSATLPATTCNELVRSYLSGAGHRPADLARRRLTPAYPGWMFADARTAGTLHMNPAHREQHMRAQRRPVRLALRDVTYRRHEKGRTPQPGERLTAVADALAPVLEHGGCAAVACATVADAQDTYDFLHAAGEWEPGELLLLHSRRSNGRRARMLRLLRRRLGPAAPRPQRLVVVTTSLLDTSLDIDVDLMVSDLASMARLLQRAGRLGRFARHPAQRRALPRPVWWDEEAGPLLTVLNPVNGRGTTALPPGWNRVEPAAVLLATALQLRAAQTRTPAGSEGLPAHTVTLPDQVQELVEAVHGADSSFAEECTRLQALLASHQARELAQIHHSAVHLVPAPSRVSSLADLHREPLTAARAATRLGVMPRQLLPCYRTPHGYWSLDREGRHPLPDHKHLGAHLIRTVLEHSLPVPAAWVAGPSRAPKAPESWQHHPLLAGTVLLPVETDHPDEGCRFGRYVLRMDPDLGLVHRREQP